MLGCMPRAKSNGLELEYETFGDRSNNPALVLVMGLGAQMIAWDAGFCRALAGEGFHVIRFDNRDIGLSTYLDEVAAPDLRAVLAGDHTAVPYLLGDMADDIVGLLDTLGIAKAHVVGASMGGMIAQQFAIDHPDRLLSLCSIMSTTGDPTVGQSTPEALAALMSPPAACREQALAQGVAAYRVLGSPGFPVDNEELLAKVAMNYDRAYHPAGSQRQTAAILASPDRTEGLRGVTVPTLVIHGDADPLVNPSGGKATAAAVPGADLLLIPGMGHDLPSGAWPAIVEAIARNTRR
jgi:pimeloyl-ACP methyl ester carboxylesterase